MKNDFNSEYTIDISDLKYQTEKGLFHIFGEFFTSEINFVRNDQPDITSCVLSLGKKAGQSICPEHESFQNNNRHICYTKIPIQLYKGSKVLKCPDLNSANTYFHGRKYFWVF